VSPLALALFATLVLGSDEERLRSAKALVFDRRYEEARAAWQEILRGSSGEEAALAAYWVARCSENLKQDARALEEYQGFLERRPRDGALAEEARSSRVAIAGRLYRAGQRQYLPVIQAALSDPSRSVRYLAAFQLAELGRPVADEALPLLKQIAAEERDPDLVARAKVLLLGLDPQALAAASASGSRAGPKAGATPRAGPIRFLRVRVFEGAGTKPTVSVNVPLSLAEFAYKSLPDDAKRELRQQGYDADNFWERLKELGPTEILTVEGRQGEKVQIWIE
jgi:tetratricopeptide (TPR) repeat protein